MYSTMNRSFRSQESQMQAAALMQRQQLRASMMKEKEEELSLFLEMRKREKEQSDLLLNNSEEEFEAPLGSKPGTSPIFNISSSNTPARKIGADDFLNSDNDKNDYDWLLTPPGTPLFPSLEMESQKTVMSQLGTSKARPTALKSRLANPQPESATRSSLVSRQPASSPGLSASNTGVRRPSSSGGPGSRPGTPTGRPTLNSTSKPSRSSTPTSRPTLSSTKPALSASKPAISASFVNVSVGESEDRLMMTGVHTVADIFCVGCGSIVGWKYETAHEKSQKYKEGKSVLKRFKVSGPDGSNYWVSQEAQIGGSDADDV